MTDDLPTRLESVLADRYRIERRLGEGATATVFLATDLKHHREVALKVLRPELTPLVGAKRFLMEIRVTAALQHPHILPLFDSGEADGLLYYVMPHATGQTLRQRLREKGQLPVDEAVAITRAVAGALDYAHRQGVIHRDIKPENILLQDGQALLADFGIAFSLVREEAERLTRMGAGVGTVLYMSPEQAFGEELGPGSDVYGLGCVVYEMLTGTPPFGGRTARGVTVRHSVDPVPSLTTHRPDLDPDLDRAVLKALEKRPEDRYPTARAFAEALGAPARPPATTRRRWAAAALLGAVAVAGLLWTLGPRSGDALDPNRVMVYPLVLPADFKGPATLGEDVATMIGHALDGAGPLRWLDGWTLLEPEIRDDIRRLSLERAASLARARNSGYFVLGRVVVRGDSADVFLDLHAADDAEAVARGRATGLLDDAWRPGLGAVNELLPALIEGGDIDVSVDWRDRPPAAIANFLLAEAAFRRVHLPEALDRYRDAVAADSTFAVAAIRGAQAATWNHRPGEASSLLTVALSRPLPPRYRHFALGYDHYLMGRADSAAAQFRLALSEDPELALAWMQLGEVYTHLLPLVGNPDSLADAAFSEARRLDPSAANTLLHPIEIRLRRGDLAAAGPMLEQFLSADPDTVEAAKFRLLRRCLSGDEAVDWPDEASRRPLAVLFAARAMGGTGTDTGCGAAAYPALLAVDTALTEEADSRRWAALLGSFTTAMALGDAEGAERVLDQTMERWGFGSTLFLMGATVEESLVARAREVADSDAATWGEDYASCPYPRRLWELGVFEALHGRPSVARAVADELDRRARTAGTRYEGGLARSMGSFAALAEGDTLRAREGFAELVPDAFVSGDLQWDEAEPRGAERLALARIELARGDAGRALAIASVFDSAWPPIYLMYLPASLELRAAAATALGDPALANRFRDRVAALRAVRSQ